MNELKFTMISEATQNFTNIYPCGNKQSLEECFTTHGDQLLFWFNTEDQSTHIMAKSLNTVTSE